MNVIAFHNSLIDIPSWGRVTLIEILWLASGLMALTFASLRVKPLWVDYTITKHLDQQDLCIIAYGYLRREVLRIITASSITFIGIYVCVTTPVTPGPARVTVTGLILTACLFVISLIVSLNSVLDWRDRNNTIAIVTKRDAHD